MDIGLDVDWARSRCALGRGELPSMPNVCADELLVIPPSFASSCLGGSYLKDSCLVFGGTAGGELWESRFEKLDMKESTR